MGNVLSVMQTLRTDIELVKQVQGCIRLQSGMIDSSLFCLLSHLSSVFCFSFCSTSSFVIVCLCIIMYRFVLLLIFEKLCVLYANCLAVLTCVVFNQFELLYRSSRIAKK